MTPEQIRRRLPHAFDLLVKQLTALDQHYRELRARGTNYGLDEMQALDLGRGARLARAAYESRTKKAPPPIVEARYEHGSDVLESYRREQLDAVP